MAKVQKAILTEYTNDGSVVMSNIRKGKADLPIIGSNETYSATLVTEWYDGSPMDDSKADGAVYLKYKGTEYPNYTGSYFRVNLPNFGELFLEKDTVAQMRGLSSTEILLLKMGYYKGVKLNGYYEKQDTPAPIEYYLSDTTESDDGGSVFEIGDIKLEHDFKGKIDVRYYGLRGDGIQEESSEMQYLIDKVSNLSGELILSPNKEYLVRSTLTVDHGSLILSGNNSRLVKSQLDNNLIELNTSKNKIYNVTFIGRYHQQNGDLCLRGDENLVSGCNFENESSAGVLIEESHGNVITGNFFSGKAFGVKARESYGNIITNNYFTGGYRKGVPASNMGGWTQVPLGDGIKLTTGSLPSGGRKTIISNNVFDKIYRDALDTYAHGEEVIFTNNIINDLQTFGIDAKVIITDSTEDVGLMPKTGKLIISNNIFINCGIMTDSCAVSILNRDIRSNPEPLNSDNGVKHVIVSDNIIEGGSMHGIVVDSCSYISINGNTFKDVPYRSVNLQGDVLNRIRVENNDFSLTQSTATGITIGSPSSEKCVIVNNRFDGLGNDTLYAISVSGNDHNISGNIIDNFRNGVNCVTVNKTFINNNHITNLTQAAFAIVPSVGNSCSKIVVSNNYVNNVFRVLFQNVRVNSLVFSNNTAHDYETFVQGESTNFQEFNNINLV